MPLLDPMMDCFMESYVEVLTSDRDFLLGTDTLVDIINNSMSRHIREFAPKCFMKKMDELGTDRMMNIDSKFLAKTIRDLKFKYSNEEVDVALYLECIFEKVNGVLTTREFLTNIVDFNGPLEEIDTDCFEQSKY